MVEGLVTCRSLSLSLSLSLSTLSLSSLPLCGLSLAPLPLCVSLSDRGGGAHFKAVFAGDCPPFADAGFLACFRHDESLFIPEDPTVDYGLEMSYRRDLGNG